MPYYQTRIYSGDVLEIEESYSFRKRGKKIPRERGKKNLTSEQQAELNFRNARKNLCRLINTNFGKEDIFITLTHAKLISIEEAEKERRNYLKRIKRLRQKKKISELKYIAVTESDGKRVHHHIIMSGIDLEDVIKKWTLGRVTLSNLDADGEYTGLANYITKEKKKKEKGKKRWSSSRNLKKPVVHVKQIRRVTPDTRTPKGYKIIQQKFDTSDLIGNWKYVKAIKIGGRDYSGKEVQQE